MIILIIKRHIQHYWLKLTQNHWSFQSSSTVVNKWTLFTDKKKELFCILGLKRWSSNSFVFDKARAASVACVWPLLSARLWICQAFHTSLEAWHQLLKERGRCERESTLKGRCENMGHRSKEINRQRRIKVRCLCARWTEIKRGRHGKRERTWTMRVAPLSHSVLLGENVSHSPIPWWPALIPFPPRSPSASLTQRCMYRLPQ